MKREEKKKVGRPKLVDDKQKKSAIYLVVSSLIFGFLLTAFSVLSINNTNKDKLLASIGQSLSGKVSNDVTFKIDSKYGSADYKVFVDSDNYPSVLFSNLEGSHFISYYVTNNKLKTIYYDINGTKGSIKAKTSKYINVYVELDYNSKIIEANFYAKKYKNLINSVPLKLFYQPNNFHINSNVKLTSLSTNYSIPNILSQVGHEEKTGTIKLEYKLMNFSNKPYYYRWFTYNDKLYSKITYNELNKGKCTKIAAGKTLTTKPTLSLTLKKKVRSGMIKVYSSNDACVKDSDSTTSNYISSADMTLIYSK